MSVIRSWHRAFSGLNPAWQAGILAMLTLLTRLPFRSSVLFTWDSANFALALLDFDIAKHRPHPPGYIWYVQLGKALTQLTHDANASFVWLSVLAGVLAVVLTYALGKQRFGASDGLVSALLLITSPLFWLYSEVALTYALEALFSVAIAYASYRALSGAAGWAYAGALLLAITGGFRQSTLILMAPLILYTILQFPWRHRLAMTGLTIIVCLAWGLPLLVQSGGLEAYLQAYVGLSSTIEPKPATEIAQALFYGLHLAALLPLGCLFGLYSSDGPDQPPWERAFLFLWIAPGLLIIAFMHLGQAGYILFLLPAAFIYTPSLLRGALEKLETVRPTHGVRPKEAIRLKYAFTLLVLFLLSGGSFLWSTNRLIQTQEAYWQMVQTLSDQYPPSQTMVLTDLSWPRGFRLTAYYMPYYHVYAFATGKVEGPFKVSDPLVVPGWLFHSYQRQDNYDLTPDRHFQTSLELLPGTDGLLVTNPALVPRGGPLPEPALSPIADQLVHVALPAGTGQIVVTDGRLELRP